MTTRTLVSLMTCSVSWERCGLLSILRKRGRATAPAVSMVTNPRLAIVRFHGRNADTWYKRTGSSRERFDYDYSATELDEWRGPIEAMAEQAESVHLLMNTNKRNQGPANAYRLARELRLHLPPPPESLRLTLDRM
jgi:uncharacterized protein YecE (DUF72 family)